MVLLLQITAAVLAVIYGPWPLLTASSAEWSDFTHHHAFAVSMWNVGHPLVRYHMWVLYGGDPERAAMHIRATYTHSSGSLPNDYASGDIFGLHPEYFVAGETFADPDPGKGYAASKIAGFPDNFMKALYASYPILKKEKVPLFLDTHGFNDVKDRAELDRVTKALLDTCDRLRAEGHKVYIQWSWRYDAPDIASWMPHLDGLYFQTINATVAEWRDNASNRVRRLFALVPKDKVLIIEVTLGTGGDVDHAAEAAQWVKTFQSWRTNENQLLTVRYYDRQSKLLEAPWKPPMGVVATPGKR